MKNLELNQMEQIEGGVNWWAFSGFSCALMISGVVSLVLISGGAALALGGAVIAAGGGTAACALTTAGAMHYQ